MESIDDKHLNTADEPHSEDASEENLTPDPGIDNPPARPVEAPLDEAVAYINEVCTRRGMEVMLEVGSFLLDRFYEGDPALLADRGRRHPTFRALAERDDLQMSATWLWRAVWIFVQLPKLPEDAATRLPPTHHALLLPIRHRAAKRELAERAIEERMSSRELAVAVEEVLRLERPLKGGRRRASRKPKPRFFRTVRKLGKVVEDEASWRDLDQIGRLRPEDAVVLRETIGQIEGRCEDLRAALRAVVSGSAVE
jgi:hypothetical protein